MGFLIKLRYNKHPILFPGLSEAAKAAEMERRGRTHLKNTPPAGWIIFEMGSKRRGRVPEKKNGVFFAGMFGFKF